MLNRLALTLSVEEPDVTTISIRPGVVDTEMQRELREVHHKTMDTRDAEKFAGLKTSGGLLKPEQPGYVMARLALDAPKELSGRFLRWVASRNNFGISANCLLAGMMKILRTFRSLETPWRPVKDNTRIEARF